MKFLSLAAALAAPLTVPTAVVPEERPVVEEQKVEYTCLGCTDKEKQALEFFVDYGIEDKAALAVVLGNIKQESLFQSNVCEGGALTSYRGCTRGGFGLIQWTSIDRYNGLGRFARRNGQSPEDFDTQLNYLITEGQWKRVSGVFKTPGLAITQYMNHAHTWLGWGIHGARTTYAIDYYNRLMPA
jgi:hypothetical protein